MSADKLNKIPHLSPMSDHVAGYPPGIYVTSDVVGHIGEGTTEQFKANSGIYDARYFKVSGQADLLTRAFGKFPDFDWAGAVDILDIGCGSGNATFTVLEMMPSSTVYATDISPDMVAILAKRAQDWGKADRIVPFVSNAERVLLNDGSFDLIIGSSMVHHLIEPEKFVDRILAALRPGGLCIFTEPFKAGHVVTRMFLDTCSTQPWLMEGIAPEILEFFRAYIVTIDAMCATDRSRLDYTSLDDKWMFPRSFFEEAGRRNGAGYGFFTTNQPENRFRTNIETLVWLGLGQKWQMPEPARSFVDRFDAALPRDILDEFASEGCIVYFRGH
jgi:SAM-dependent methyltransferase